ncbi:gamma-glutamyl-gamma-aminobutyrate hydrolase family protein [Streptomyces sp. NPDC093252]|uniref:gamma-glutamyl-gamma-aminobutyrate hydrolase family protein n=1 Tax=Streptomyces sp. NPDC093252 TaxID=3154980 RepID=UPI00341E4ED5
MDNEPNKWRPRIAVCGVATQAAWGYWAPRDAVLVAGTYLDAVVEAGGLPVVLPPVPGLDPRQALAGVDGILIPGGVDVAPERYRALPSDRMEDTSQLRDEFELAVVRAAFEARLPMLGICRGLHIMNVATGGTLHQHLLDAGYGEHRPVPGSLGPETSHDISVNPDSHMARCGMALAASTNSHHHQGIAEVGAGGRVVAHAVADKVIEAIEWPDNPFALGVQFHPEEPRMAELFVGLVKAAGARPDGRRALK